MIDRILRSAKTLLTRRIDIEVDKVPLPQTRLSSKRLLNWFLTESSVYLKPQKAWGMPTFLQIEPTSHCNLRCRVCPVATGLGRDSGHMDFTLFKGLMDELGDYLLVMMFWDWGEPLLNPRALDMINYAKTKGIRVVISTNGHLLADEKLAAGLVDSGVDQIIFSVDGISQETYQHFRTRGDLETVLNGVRQTVKQKKLQHADNLTINLRFIVMKHNQDQIDRLPALAESLGVDILSLRRFYSVPNRKPGEAFEEQSMLPDNTEHQIPPRLSDSGQALRVSRNPCRNLWNSPTIHWDGKVCSCFMDYNGTRILGDLKQKSFRNIWQGQAYRSLRRDFKQNWQSLHPCSVCSYGYKLGDLAREANYRVMFMK